MGRFSEKASKSSLESAITKLEGVDGTAPEEPFELRQNAAIKQREAIIEWAGESGLILDPSEFPGQPVAGGAEHEVFPFEGEFWKITHKDSFGWVPIAGDDGFPEVDPATPLDYLIRWRMANRVLGDRVMLRGITLIDEGLSLVVSQPAIAGENATANQICEGFCSYGFWPVSEFVMGAEVNSTYYDPARRLGIFDASGDNVLISNGMMAPIDVVVMEVGGELHQQLLKLLKMPDSQF